MRRAIKTMLTAAGLLALTAGAALTQQTPDLTITKTGPATATAGQVFTYNVTVTNNGPGPITIPPGTVLARDTLTGDRISSRGAPQPYGSTQSSDGTTVDFFMPGDASADVIPSGGTRTFLVHVIADGAGKTITNTAIVDPNGAIVEGNETNNTSNTVTTTTSAGQADLGIAQTDAPDPVAAGQQLTYTLQVANGGPTHNATGARVTDTLPANTTFVSVTPPGGGTCDTSGSPVIVTCDLGFVNVGDTPEVTIVVVPGSAGTLTNTATVSTTSIDNNPDNDSDTETTIVTAPPATNGCTIQGTPGDDILTGTSAGEVICGLGGDDTITGGGGADLLKGNGGKDFLDGVRGNDVLKGGYVGKDTCRADRGDTKKSC